jgi:benzoyl-CoA reductase/2-hydroxyglutaryl-CoA dehydratase subunit BcrC/BadD/HgdB
MRVGFTTSIPVEILLAAGHVPVDLNNAFINAPEKLKYVDLAEREGMPRNICSWIKGIYTAVRKHEVDEVIAVIQGDCSYSHALMEVLEHQGIPTCPFSYPYDRDPRTLRHEMEKLMSIYGTNTNAVEFMRRNLRSVRALASRIDELTWSANLVSGRENHYYLVSSTDFMSDVARYTEEAEKFLDEVELRIPFQDSIRLAYIGVPPIMDGLYDYLESRDARVVFNEIQRQFSMPFNVPTLEEQYLSFTYPYSVFDRIKDIRFEIGRRKVDGIIQYVQSFCHRQIETMIFSKELGLPMLLIEGDRPGNLDNRLKVRIDAFLELLKK